jgi:hypothetical protein
MKCQARQSKRNFVRPLCVYCPYKLFESNFEEAELALRNF